MDYIARIMYYSGISLYFIGLIFLFLQKDKTIKKAFYGIVITALIIQTVSIVLYTIKYVTTRHGVPLDMKTQDCLFRSWGLGIILLFASKRYNTMLLSGAIIFTILLLFISAFPMPLVPDMMMCHHLSGGIAMPIAVLIYDFSVVLFAYCFGLSVAYFFKKQSDEDAGINSAESLYNRIYQCAIWGLSVFTLSQIVGSFGKLIYHGTYWAWNPIHLLFLSIWMLYAGMIHIKWVNGLSEKTLPIMGIIGFIGIIGFRVIMML